MSVIQSRTVEFTGSLSKQNKSFRSQEKTERSLTRTAELNQTKFTKSLEE